MENKRTPRPSRTTPPPIQLPAGPVKIGYARVSTADQDPEMQMIDLQRYGCDLILQEHGSGAKRDRPELNRVLDLLRPGDCLVLWKLDRLSRSTLDLLSILDTLGKRGVDFVSLGQRIDTTDMFGRAMVRMIAMFAELERDMIMARTLPGMAAAREVGHFGGAPRVLRGKKLERAKALYAAHEMTHSELARSLGISRSTLERYCRDHGVPRGKRDLPLFLKAHPDAEKWLAESDDPRYGRNPKRPIRQLLAG